MKKQLLICAACVVVAMTMTSCLTSLLRGLAAVEDEVTEVTSGKLYTTERGTVIFSDGMKVMFVQNGAVQRVERENEIRMCDGEQLIVCDTDAKTYYVVDAYGEYDYSYVVYEKVYEWGGKIGNLSVEEGTVTKGTKTIAGQTCKTFTIRDEDDVEVIASWNRFEVYASDDGEVELEAVSISATAPSASELMAIPEGYTLSEYDY